MTSKRSRWRARRAFGAHGGRRAAPIWPELIATGVILLGLLALAACSAEPRPEAAASADAPPSALASAADGAPQEAAASPDPDVRFGNVTLATGVRMHFAEQGPADGTPVLLVHGYSDSWFSFSTTLPLLPDTWRVFAPSLRGHGDSDRPQSGYAMRDFAADIVAFMDAQGIDRAVIVGHSMGSFVAQQVAVLAPERVSGLVLMGSAASPHDAVTRLELKPAVDPLTDPVPLDFIQGFQESTVHAPLPPGFMDAIIAENRKLPARVWQAAVDGMLATHAATELSANAPPTLILWGDKDVITPGVDQDALVALLPHAEFKVYPETGHGMQWERPAEIARDIVAFVERLSAR
jgi:pimeloyl-ACP methyl ester carboxylesterase